MKKIIYLVVLAIVTASCVDETYYGESSQANISAFTIEGEMSNKIEPLIDWNDVGTISIVVPSSFDLAKLKVTRVVCSQLAHFTTNPDTLTNFTKPVELYVVAENQAVKKKWVVTVTQKEIEKTQLSFSNFKTWYAASNSQGTPIKIKEKQGYWPGNGKDYSPWQSSIEGNAVAASGLTDFSVVPTPQWDMAQYAHLTTIKTITGSIIGTGLAAGGLFTGYFALDFALVMSKQARKNINSGVPFYSKPKAVKFDMRYKAGQQMLDGNLKPYTAGPGKPAQDSCDIQIILQNRLTNRQEWIRIAATALRTPALGNMNSENGFVSMTMPFVYGEPTAEQIKEKPYIKIGGSVGELYYFNFTSKDGKWIPDENPVKEVYAADPDEVAVDNILVMFTSSAYGDAFYGAEGSTLDVMNFELIYE